MIEKQDYSPKQTSSTHYPFLAGDKARLEELISVLSTTKLGSRLLDDAREAGITITTASLRGSHGSYSHEKKLVSLNTAGSLDRQVVTLAHELRHAQQFKNGVQLDAFKDAPKDYLHSQGLIEADANAASCVVAWDLKQQGYPKPLEEFSKEHPLIAEPFVRTAENTGAANGEAAKEAFFAWFNDMYIRNSYEKNYLRNFNILKSHATRAECESAMQRSVPVTDNAAKICKIDGKTYLSEKEVKEFFDRPEMSSIGHETFYAIYRNLRDIKKLGFMSDPKEVMTKEGNFTIRETIDYYDIKPSLAQRQQNAAEKISQYKQKKETSNILASAITAIKRKNAFEK